MNLAAFLVGMVGPLMARWLASVGLSLVVVGGLATAVSTLKTTITSSIAGLPLNVIQLGGLFGIWHCFGMVLGAATFVITWHSTRGFWTLAKK
jgi:hypothetical protein